MPDTGDEDWRSTWWLELLCPACKAGQHAACDPAGFFCECAVEVWLTPEEN